MTIHPLDRNQAAEKFVKLLVQAVYSPSHEHFIDMLTGAQPARILADLPDWFQALTEEDRDKVKTIIKKAIDFALFNLLCLLDGVSGFEWLEEKPIHYALFLEVFRDMEALDDNESELSVRINPAEPHGYEL